ncbi:MAG: tetratricopeptide repeat protein [bacterium]|nr:tetratricopeptide repeat protein [bacterium]
MRQRSIFAALLLLFFALAPAPVRAQDGKDPAKQIESFKKYLARKPYNAWAFDSLVEKAVAINGLQDLVTAYEQLVEEDPAGIAGKVVLARLYAVTDERDRGLEVLNGIEKKDAQLLALTGEFYLARNEVAKALEVLEEAVASTKDEELLEALNKKLGKAFLASGDREKAYAAFQALAALDPENFHLRLEAASELADHGLHEEALTEFAVAEELAGKDTSKRCRVMAEMGRLQEQLTQYEQALGTYDEAIGLMARGNWLKRDLFERVLAIHKRGGSLEDLLGTAQASADANSQDLDAREFHARVLEELTRRDEARDVLQAATADFPKDLKLSRRLIEALENLEDTDGLIAEYQRILLEQPEELELYLELGKVFASEGRLEQARLQWNQTLEKRLTDSGLCVRLASFYALYDQPEDAVAMYEKAITLEPAEMRHYADLAAFLSVRDRRDEVPALLERAATQAQGNVARLDDLSSLWSEYGHPERAREVLEAAIEIAGDDARLFNRLADLLIREGNHERASSILHDVINRAKEATLRTSAVDKLVRLYRNTGRTDALTEFEQEAVDGGSTDVAPYLILGKLHKQRRDPESAIQVYEQLLAVQPTNEESRKSLARMYEDRGDHRAALEQYETLIAQKPQARRKYLKEVARIHLALLDQNKAFECYDEILRGAPDNPAAFKEVADAYEKLGLHDKVAECMQQAVRLKPTDGEYRLDLANAYKRMGEWDKAREQTQLAVESEDEDTRDKARQAYYVLLSEAGRIEEEISNLRRRVQDNPYDGESPLMLVDIYVRELEYELALEMLERLLTFQPRESKLLDQRGRIYALMERFDDAIADYEALWKLPDSDRTSLAVKIGEASIQGGNLQRAEQVLAQVSDPNKVARLYDKHELYDEAIEALEKGIAGAPSNGRMLLKLASVQEKIGRREDSAETLERMLSLQGDSWRVLKRLGDLYDDLHEKERSLEIGKRLFGLIRVPDRKENDDPDKDKKSNPWAASRRSSYYYSSRNTRYHERVQALKTYFEEKGYVEDFLELGITEVKKHPANDALFDTVWYTFEQVGDREEEARELIREVREGTVDKRRIPPSYTRETWANTLDSREVGLYRENAAFGETRLAELGERATAGNATEPAFVERAQLLGYLQRDDERAAVLREGLELFPDSYRLWTALGVVLQSEKDYTAAAEAFTKLVPLLEASGLPEAEKRRLDKSFRKQQRQYLQGFPPHIQRRVKDEHIRRLYGLTYGPSTSLSWGLGTTPSLDGARLRLAQCRLKLDEKDEARAVLVSLEPENPEFITRWTSIAKAYFKEEMYADAEQVYVRLEKLDRELGADPIIGHNRSWSSRFNDAMKDFAFILEKRGEYMRAFDLLRSYGSRNQGELMLTTHEMLDGAEAYYREQMDAASAALDAEAEGEEDTTAWRNASLKLADVLAFQKRWDEVLAVHEMLAERIEGDFTVLKNIAALHQRAARVDDAIATHYRIIDRKRELNRLMRRREKPTGRVLAPVAPQGLTTSSDYNITRLGRSYYGSTASIHNVRENFSAILKLYLDQKRTSEATEVLRQIAREDAVAFRRMGYTVRNLVNQYQLGADAVPIMRLLHSYNPDDSNTALEYAKAMIKANKLDDAHKVLTQVMNKAKGSSFYVDRARKELDELELRMGYNEKFTLEDLRESAESDVKNVRSRMKFARRLFKLRRYDDALAEGRRAEDLAPHLDHVSKFVTECLQVLDRREELEERIVKLRDKTNDKQKKFTMTVQLANWMLERGEIDAIDAMFGETFQVQSGGWVDFAPSSWYIEKGRFDKAKELLEEEIASVGRGQWVSDEAQMRLEALHLLDGDPTKALDKAWERFEKANGRQQKITFFGQLPGILRRLPDLADYEDELKASAAEHGGLRGALYETAFYLALGEMDEVESRLDTLSQTGEEAVFLYPVLIDLARQRGDLETAYTYLERLEAQHKMSKSRKVGTAIGSISEKNAVIAEKAGILHDLGREEEAFAMLEQMLEGEDEKEARPIKKSIASMYERWEDAARLTREQIDDEGEKSYGTLNSLATYELEMGNTEEALAILRRSLILSGRNDSVRRRLMDVYRKTGELETYLDELLEEAAQDPDDAKLARVLIEVALELDRSDVAIETATRLAERSEEQASILPFLMRAHMRLGEPEKAFAAREQLLDTGAKANVRSGYALHIAAFHAREDRFEEAVQAIKKGYGDEDTVESRRAVMSFLQGWERWEETLAAADAVLELAPQDSTGTGAKIRALGKLDRSAEALEICFEVLLDPEREDTESIARIQVALRAGGLAVEDEWRAKLEADASDVDALFRLGMLYVSRSDWKPAAEHLDALLELQPDHRRALQEVWKAHYALGHKEKTRAALEANVDMLDREQGVIEDSWRMRNKINNHRRLLGELEMLDGDREACLAQWERPIGERYKEVQSYMYAYYNSPLQDKYSYTSWLRSHGMYKEYVETERARGWFDNWGATRNKVNILYARFDAGEHDEVLEEAWIAVAEPGRGLVVAPSSGYYFSSYSSSNIDPNWSALIGFHEQLGRMDELKARIEKELEADPEDAVMTGLRDYIRAQDEEWEAIAKQREELLEKNEGNVTAMQKLAEAYIELERYEEALALLGRVFARQRAKLPNAQGDEYVYTTSVKSGRKTKGQIRFKWGGSSSNYGGGIRYYSSRRNDGSTTESATRRSMMALLMKLGRRDEALELERIELDLSRLDANQYLSMPLTLASAYAKLELDEEVERLALLAVERSRDDGKRAHEQMLTYFRKREDAERRREYAEKLLPALDESVEESPYSARVYVTRAQHKLWELGDADGARADCEVALAFEPYNDGALRLLAWAAFRAGQKAEALQAFEEVERLTFALGKSRSADLYYGLGLARAEAPEAEAALRKALSMSDTHRMADEARARLE